MTGGLDTTCVINAISRFCDVRGIPDSITSDNQASFHRADDDLKEWYQSIDWDRVARETSFGFKKQVNGGLVVSAVACHPEDPGSSPGGGFFRKRETDVWRRRVVFWFSSYMERMMMDYAGCD
jgi:hypothetical protein